MSTTKKWDGKDDESDEEEDEDVVQYQSAKDAVLFAINVSDSMLSIHDSADPMDDDDDSKSKPKSKSKKEKISAVHTALHVAYAVLQSRIISNPNDMMGIMLFGTDKTLFQGETSGGFAHTYVLLDLDVPDAEGIKGLKKLIEDPEEFDKLMVPSKEPVSMANVLFGANQIFTTKAANFQSRRLFIVTDDDDPHAKDKALKNSAITRARDLYDLGVRIDPFYISNPGGKGFDPSKFYDDIIYRSPTDDDDDQAIPLTSDGNMRLKEMVSTIKSKSTAKRALFTCKLEIGPGLSVGVKGYILYKRQEKARGHYVYTGGETAQLVKGTTTKIAESTAKVVEKTEIRKAYKFGGEQVVFTPEEMKQIRNFGDPVIRIIGFKPQSSLIFDHNLKPANFIYPDEADLIGSTRTFAALHKKLAVSEKIGVAWSITRRGAAPQLVAIMPSLEVVENGVQVHPPGMFLIPVPFADDVRQNPELPLVKAPAELIDKMRAVVKQLHMPKGYAPEKYSNPSLQWHYRILQAIALDEDLPDQPIDTTLPKYKLIHKHAGGYVVEWGEELEKLCLALPVRAEPKGKKRTVTLAVKDEEEAPAFSKKAKTSTMGVDEFKEAFTKGTLNKLTVAQLKSWMPTVGLDISGKKADLIERVEEYFETK